MPEFSLPIVPFDVPDTVRLQLPPRNRGEGMFELPPMELKDLDERTLADLCIEFRKSVFEKAGKEDPDAPHSH